MSHACLQTIHTPDVVTKWNLINKDKVKSQASAICFGKSQRIYTDTFKCKLILFNVVKQLKLMIRETRKHLNRT